MDRRKQSLVTGGPGTFSPRKFLKLKSMDMGFLAHLTSSCYNVSFSFFRVEGSTKLPNPSYSGHVDQHQYMYTHKRFFFFA